MKLKAVIVDDEKLAREIIKNYLKDHPLIEVAAECSNGFEGIKSINELKPDLVFLDIQMPKINGFEMLELLDDPPSIIFSTAFDQYALKAFEVNAVDYLLKPFSQDRFNEALSKAYVYIKDKTEQNRIIQNLIGYYENKIDYLDKVVVKDGSEALAIPVEKIKWIEAHDDHVLIYSDDGKYLKQKTLDYFENHLNPREFTRTDNHVVVSTEEIKNFGQPGDKFNHNIKQVHQSPEVKTAADNRKEKIYKHKLLTIMFTDIKDYSKKMNLDERLAIEMLDFHNKILNSAIKYFSGNVIETIGDSFLAAFESAAAAAECAVQIQQSFADYNKGKLPDEKIELRISLHLGDVVQFGNGLKGDVVNVAARIQELTPAGAIYISQSVYNTIKNKTHFLFQELGTYSIKNIREPITLYKILS
ncbi:MAG TPA: response regulator [Ignavibacteriaceae bacterium]|nr:response regulator [Ignavibacteriaceae bacterium]